MKKYKELCLLVFDEINSLRSEPSDYVQTLEEYEQQFRDDLILRPGNVPIRTQEGSDGVMEAMEYVSSLSTPQQLKQSSGLSAIAQLLANDSQQKIEINSAKLSQYLSEYGNWNGGIILLVDFASATPSEVVCNFLVDDGIPSRCHRKALLKKSYKYAGVGFGPHPDYQTVWVVILAKEFTEKEGIQIVEAPNSPAKATPEAGDWLEGAKSLRTEVDFANNLIKKWTMTDGSIQITKHSI